MTRLIPTWFLAGMLGLMAWSASVAAQDLYIIKLQRPLLEARRYKVSISNDNLQKQLAKVGDVTQKTQSHTVHVLEGTARVVKVDAMGDPIAITYSVTRCVTTVDGKESVLLRTGSLLAARLDAAGTTVLTVDGFPIGDADKEAVIQQLVHVGSSQHGGMPQNIDESYGVSTPVKLGDTWLIKNDDLMNGLTAGGMAVTPDRIKSSGKLSALKQLGSVPWTQVDIVAAVDLKGVIVKELPITEGAMQMQIRVMQPVASSDPSYDATLQVESKTMFKVEPTATEAGRAIVVQTIVKQTESMRLLPEDPAAPGAVAPAAVPAPTVPAPATEAPATEAAPATPATP